MGCRIEVLCSIHSCLTPYASCLVGSTFCMLEGILSWWNRVICLFFSCKQVQPCHVNFIRRRIHTALLQSLRINVINDWCCWMSFEKTTVAWSHAFQTSQANFFPLPRNADITSQPLKAWENRISLFFFSRPSTEQISWTVIHFRPCLWWEAIHSFARPSSFSDGKDNTWWQQALSCVAYNKAHD